MSKTTSQKKKGQKKKKEKSQKGNKIESRKKPIRSKNSFNYLLGLKSNDRVSELLCLVILVFFSLSIYMYVFDAKLDMNGDNASYYMLASSLSKFYGYVNYYQPFPSIHSHFPPGYPSMIFPFFWLNDSLEFIKSLNGILYILSSLLIFKIIRRVVSQNSLLSLIMTVAVSCNYYLLKYSTIIMSEVPLIFTNLLAIYLILKIKDDSLNTFKLGKKEILLVLVTALAYHIKTLAIPIFLGIIAHYLLNKKYKKVISITLVFIILLTPWQIRNKIHGTGEGYVSELMKVNPYDANSAQMGVEDFIDRVKLNFSRYYSKEIPVALFSLKELGPNDESSSIYKVTGIIAIAFMFVGLLTLVKLKTFLVVYIGATYGILLLWPEVWWGPRFMLSMVPILLMLFYLGITYPIKFLTRKFELENLKYANLILPLIFIFWISGIIPTKVNELQTIKTLNAYSKVDYQSAFKNFTEIGEYVRKYVDKKYVVASRKPVLFFAFSRGKTTGFPRTVDYNEFFNGLWNQDAKYLLVDQLGYSTTKEILVPMVQNYPQKFKLIHQTNTPETYLYEIIYE